METGWLPVSSIALMRTRPRPETDRGGNPRPGFLQRHPTEIAPAWIFSLLVYGPASSRRSKIFLARSSLFSWVVRLSAPLTVAYCKPVTWRRSGSKNANSARESPAAWSHSRGPVQLSISDRSGTQDGRSCSASRRVSWQRLRSARLPSI